MKLMDTIDTTIILKESLTSMNKKIPKIIYNDYLNLYAIADSENMCEILLDSEIKNSYEGMVFLI